MQMTAIPTVYAGVQFRSRLEAKWAAMFDLLGWKWEYEPFDLNGYIPDFLLGRFCDGDGALVEVRPVIGVDWDTRAIEQLLHTRHQHRFEMLVLGDPEHMTYVRRHNGRVGRSIWCDCDRTSCGLCPVFHTGCDDDETCMACCAQFPTLAGRSSTARIMSSWREAGNRVQWRSPRAQAR